MTDRTCPNCGTSLEGALVVRERLEALGYRHRDVTLECPSCDWTGAFGIPVDRVTDDPPVCRVCGGRTYPYKLDYHAVREHLEGGGETLEGWDPGWVLSALTAVDVHWKCEDCFFFENRSLNHLVEDVFAFGVGHLMGARNDS